MAKVSIVLDQRKANKDGLFPIKLQITSNGTATMVSTGVFVPARAFAKGKDKPIRSAYPNSVNLNKMVYGLYLKYANAINGLLISNNVFTMTATDIREYIEGKKKAKPVSLSQSLLYKKENSRAQKTGDGYSYANDTLCRFMNKSDVKFDDMNYANLCAFDRWMENNKLSINTRGNIMRYIRCAFNTAIKEDVIPRSLYPFDKFTIKRVQKAKEYISVSNMRLLINMELSSQNLTIARDLFMLSFYLCGINLTDLLSMQKPNAAGEVVYVRKKIEYHEPEPVRISLTPEARAIVDKYAGKDRLLCFCEEHAYNTFTRRVSFGLSRIGDMLGIHLHPYMARYTWATYADHLEISHDVISKALGHTDNSTAERYYISFDWGRVDCANRKVLDYVCNA